MTPIPWRDIPEPTVEQMIAVLLSHLYGGQTTRIDGRGGDDGRDIQFPTPDGIRAFEVKSFTGRMSPGRRSQVQSSLETAACLAPVDWTLLVPIDPTPRELEWFEWLATTVPFPIYWRGLTWLDAEFAQRPFIARYYLEGADSRLMEMAQVFNQEKAALAGGAPDVLDRMRGLVTLANELDPHYRFAVESDGELSSIRLIPRYAGAERDRPITVHFTVAFPTDEAGSKAEAEFRRGLDFGTPVDVPEEYLRDVVMDAPANLGGTLDKPRVEMRSTSQGDKTEMIIAAVAPDGRTLGEVPIGLSLESAGQRGAIHVGSDISGTMSVRATFDKLDSTVQVTITVKAQSFYPAELRAAARVLVNATTPNVVELRSPKGERMGTVVVEEDEPLLRPEVLRLVEDLALLQWASGRTRKVGPSISLEDGANLLTAVSLLRGEPTELRWNQLTLVLSEDAPEEFRRALATSPVEFQTKVDRPWITVIEETDYEIGRGYAVLVRSAVLAPEHDEWRQAGCVPVGVEVHLVPGESDLAEALLLAG